METPVSAYLKLKSAGACFLLESAENNETLGRYSFIGLNPVFTLRLAGKKDYLPALRKSISLQSKGTPTLLGGLVGYIGYETANSFEGLPLPEPNQMDLPDVYMVRPETLVMFDHFKRRINVFTTAERRLDEVIAIFRSASLSAYQSVGAASRWTSGFANTTRPPIKAGEPTSRIKTRSNFSSAGYRQIVSRAKEYIRAGDIFQVVLAHCISGETAVEPFQVYRAMRMLNPSPYMFFFDAGDFCMAGSSPEMLVKLEGGDASLCPIAGTRPRGKTPEIDARLASELLANPKENAEHSMLVDLGRNDLGRVCEFGSVNIREHKKIERYSHVMHLVSTVGGRLKKGQDMFDLFRAAFPAGTVTGAPKIRAMEIITELERTRRGPYAGAMGYFGANGNMDMCLTIRTIIFKGNRYFIQAGAGIVYDSNPAAEYAETLNKMAIMRKAVEMAENWPH